MSTKKHGGSKPLEKRSDKDFNIILDSSEVGGIPVEVVGIGELVVTSGEIVVCDPLAIPDMPPLQPAIPPGKYPVTLHVAKTRYSGNRNALARLVISDKRAVKWVMALGDGEEAAELEEDEYFGFPVDAGVGGFFDREAGVEYLEFIEKFMEKRPAGNIYDDLFYDEFRKNAMDPEDPVDSGAWVNYTLPSGVRNITMFHSGYGDGFYPAYWGMTADDEIVSLVIDFQVLLNPDEDD
ncbi:DUF4241 domain-containing protein [Myxococcota bacterium]|nr:DUF4241 domain-containing protein [Myxococcota bacterium]MBU1535482.1 DUF4241 domain-containing protein [Myxococcota bacterium]